MLTLRDVCNTTDAPARSGSPVENAAARLQLRKKILEIIAVRREREGDPSIGSAIERRILNDELSRVE